MWPDPNRAQWGPPLRIPIAISGRLEQSYHTWEAAVSLCSSCYPLLDLNSPLLSLAHRRVAAFFALYVYLICLLKGDNDAQKAQGCITERRRQLVMTQHCQIPTLLLSPAPAGGPNLSAREACPHPGTVLPKHETIFPSVQC